MQNILNRMKSANLKGKTIAIALILLLTMSSAVAILPTIKAQTFPYSYTPTMGANGLWNLPTFPGLTVAPNPVGVGQTVEVILLIELLPPSIGRECSTVVTGGWLGFVLSITDPNGTTTTMGPFESTPSGTYQVTFVPDTVGTYSFQFTFPGQIVNGTGYGSYYANFMASTSDKVSLTVQQAQVAGYAEAPIPLPTQYYTYPINAQNRYWNSISGPWLQNGYNTTGAFNPYTYAPDSAHILWTQQLLPDNGLIGGAYGSLSEYGTGFSTAIILNGYMYFNGPADASNGTAVSKIYCENLQTGALVWKVPGSITNGQLLDWRSQQSKIVYPYLWSIAAGSYKMYSATTGALLDQWSGSNVLSGTVVLEPPNPTAIGETISGGQGGGALLDFIYGHNTNAATGWLVCWNSTLALGNYNLVNVSATATGPMVDYSYAGENPQTWSLPALTTTLNWSLGIMWNMTIPLTSLTTSTGGSAPAAWSITAGAAAGSATPGADQHYVVLRTPFSSPVATGTEYLTLAAINVANKPETLAGQQVVPTQGTFAWIENITVPAYDMMSGSSGIVLRSDGNIIMGDQTLMSVQDFSESTGALLWADTVANNDFALQNVQGITGYSVVAYGMLYDPGYDGYMHALNTTTGVQQWNTTTRTGGLEMPEPAFPCLGCAVADGKVFTSTAKSYETEPKYRGHCLYCFDAYTGAQLWNVSGQYSIQAIADGILVGTNAYDSCVYAFSRGPTATTVSAPQTTITAGQSVVIQGTVTDQTPTSQAKGTAAISDAWMTPWMEYLYMDQPMPTSATGVPVQIDAIDPNGNFIHIGNATSDITGMYSYQWTPPDIPGKYTITATFSADNSYYGSSGETAAVVVPAATTVTPTPTPTSVADMYFVPAIAGLAVLIIVGLIVLALLMLRKRP